MGLREAVTSIFQTTRVFPGGEKSSSGFTDYKPLGRYETITKLGQGASGVVYEGWDQYIKRRVAIKVLQHTSDKSRKRFFGEAQLAGLLRHPNIVVIHDADVYGDACYIAMEYVKGPTLEKFCNKDSLLPLNKSLEIILDVCNALDYANRQGIIHRDIKPSNIILAQGGFPKITDFGIAQMTGKTIPFGVFGTPSYISPEHLKDEVVDSKSDIFSLGCVLYELLSGEKAFSGDNCYSILYKIINEEPVSIKNIRPDIPKTLEQITKRALAKNPERRYQNFIDFAYDLKATLRDMTCDRKNEKINEFVEFVHRLPFFHNFTEEQLRELVIASSIVKVHKGKVIISEGEIDDTFYIILSGKAKIRKDDKNLAQIEAGECFGEMALIGGQTRAANVIADMDCVLMKISANIFDQSPQSSQLLFFTNFARTLARRLSEAAEKKLLN
jgi:serine/threonine-protein kinase